MAAEGNSIDPSLGSIAIDRLETGMWRNPLPESPDMLQHVVRGFKGNRGIPESSLADRCLSFALQWKYIVRLISILTT